LHFLRPQDLVAAILTPGSMPAARMRPQMELQQFYASLTETQKSIIDRRRFVANFRRLRRARDVTWSWQDPVPFLTMPITSWKIIAMAIRQRATFGAVATLDVGWYAEQPSPLAHLTPPAELSPAPQGYQSETAS
jgi:hypothetical protein